jgi:hypothetical protein
VEVWKLQGSGNGGCSQNNKKPKERAGHGSLGVERQRESDLLGVLLFYRKLDGFESDGNGSTDLGMFEGGLVRFWAQLSVEFGKLLVEADGLFGAFGRSL